MLKSRTLGLASLLICLLWASSSHAQFRLTAFPPQNDPPTGGQFQIGTGLPLPPQGFLGGMTPGDAATPFWPPLLVPPTPAVTATAPATTVMGGPGPGMPLMVPAGVLGAPAPGIPLVVPVFPTNAGVFQVATSISYAWPAAPATFAPGGGPGPGVFSTLGPLGGPIGVPLPGGGIIAYSGGLLAFGGPAQFATVPGPGAAAGRVPPNGMGVLPVASVWINFLGAGTPVTAAAAAIVGASAPAGVFQPGAQLLVTPPGPHGGPIGITAFGPLSPAALPYGLLNMTTPAGPFVLTVTPGGFIPASTPIPPGAPFPPIGLSNMVTGSKGFPWTTGFITAYAPAGGIGNPKETFFLSGADQRLAGGIGNISMVSGAISLRALSGPNANRGWVSLNLLPLPEPGVALGTAGALVTLGLLHGLVRRRSR